jgi:ribosome maturation factor RimP
MEIPVILHMITDEARRAIEASIASHEATLIDLHIRGEQRQKVVELFVDSIDGVTPDLCADVSRSVGKIIEDAGLVKGPFRLVVSSPGIDRPLQHRWQYTKHIGRRMRLRVQQGEIVEILDGILVHTGAEDVELELDDKSMLKLAFESIIEARVQPPW